MNDTYDDTVGAVDGSARALGARADTHNTDGAAGEAEEHVKVAQVDTQEAEESRACSRVSL